MEYNRKRRFALPVLPFSLGKNCLIYWVLDLQGV